MLYQQKYFYKDDDYNICQSCNVLTYLGVKKHVSFERDDNMVQNMQNTMGGMTKDNKYGTAGWYPDAFFGCR